MLPRLQPPKTRKPPLGLKLDTHIGPEAPPANEFATDVRLAMNSGAQFPFGAPAPPVPQARPEAPHVAPGMIGSPGLANPYSAAYAPNAASGNASPTRTLSNETAASVPLGAPQTLPQTMPHAGVHPDIAASVAQAAQAQVASTAAVNATAADTAASGGMSALDWYTAYAQSEIEELRELGEGSGGTVHLCRLKTPAAQPYSTAAARLGVFAIKEIPANPDPELRKQILRELQFNRSCQSPYIVNYFGAFLVEEVGQIYISMEYCEGGSLQAILQQVVSKGARISEKVLACVATSVLEGITYLYGRKIIHRDIKPQNILLTKDGEVKLCDFGVSGEVVDSLVTTFTGTSYYMAPERIRGQPYTVTSDVWSLGITLMELAMGRFPFDKSIALTPIELLTQIVNSPAPQLPEEPGIKWSASFHHFLASCLEKNSVERPPPQKLLTHPWIRGHRQKRVDMAKFVSEAWK